MICAYTMECAYNANSVLNEIRQTCQPASLWYVPGRRKDHRLITVIALCTVTSRSEVGYYRITLYNSDEVKINSSFLLCILDGSRQRNCTVDGV